MAGLLAKATSTAEAELNGAMAALNAWRARRGLKPASWADRIAKLRG